MKMITFFFFLFLLNNIILFTQSLPKTNPDAYNHWGEAPEYCMTKEQLKKSRIKPLTSQQLLRQPELLQVQIVARHGARAPYYRAFCWDQKESPIDAEWNCGTSEVVSQDIFQSSLNPERGYGRLYKKQFIKGQNILTGTCVVGGLLPFGRYQHHENGRILQETYIGFGHFKLFNSSNLSNIPDKDIYLRSDDQERTLGSLQALVDGMFPRETKENTTRIENMKVLHTADFSNDIVYPNNNICPMLNILNAEATAQKDIECLNHQKEVVELEKKISHVVGRFSWDSILECLMIARCNNIPLPHNFTEDMFNQAIKTVERREFLRLNYNNSIWSKTGVSALMNEVVERMKLMIQNHQLATKLAIVIGHDSTQMPIMASLLGSSWDGKWAPYAGMIIFELYRINEPSSKSKHAVRLLYKGIPLKIRGCTDELCNFDEFLRVMEFATNPPTCYPVKENFTQTNEQESKSFEEEHTFIALAGVIFAIGMYTIFQSIRRKTKKYSPESISLL